MDLQCSSPGKTNAPHLVRVAWFNLRALRKTLMKFTKKSCHAPIHNSFSSALTSVNGTKEKGYIKVPLLEEVVAKHLCLPMALGWKIKAVHASKPCRTICPYGQSICREWSGWFCPSYNGGPSGLPGHAFPHEMKLVLAWRPSKSCGD